MQLNTLKRRNPRKRSVKVGRGGKRGKTSGRGTKGQNARAGRKKRPEMRDIIKKLPKLRGYSFNSIVEKPQTVALRVIEKRFKAGDQVSPQSLVAVRAARSRSGALPEVKIVGNEISIKVSVVGCLLSAGARKAIEAAGGSVA